MREGFFALYNIVFYEVIFRISIIYLAYKANTVEAHTATITRRIEPIIERTKSSFVAIALLPINRQISSAND
ncbi:MAG TPA: hypothetical protein VIL03_00545 [Clostridia bacterium]